MEFLKALFENGEALTYDQLAEKVRAGKFNVVNIADGSYVSKAKFDDKVGTLTQQVTDLQGQITQRDTDLKDLQGKLTSAQADAGKLGEVQTAFTDLQTKYTTDQQTWEQKHQQQAYEFMVRERTSALKFSSPAAKRDFIREVNEKGLKVDGDSLLGYEDFVTKYKADNPGALVDETPAGDKPATPLGAAPGASEKQPTIVLPNTQQPAPEKSVFGFHFNGVRPKPSEEK